MTDLQHGCRADYGPLVLRIQTTASSNGFLVYVEDPRIEHRIVYEHPAQSTLESAQEHAVDEADKYLGRAQGDAAPPPAADWRCS
jgi:hypothetical protein